MIISIAVTVCNEANELKLLLDFLQEHALHDQYEIIVQIDKDKYVDEVVDAIVNRGIKHYFHPLNKDFASYKNELFKHCSGEFILQLDADEMISVDFLRLIPQIIESNSEVDLYYIPRINTVEGLTQEDILKWGWQVKGDRINHPDYQSRLYRNNSNIRWKNKVHEVIEGHKQYTFLPPVDELSLIHHKTIEKQRKQNQFYNTI
jgi:glycosyltransferase involved in cell wall biosynthesis